MSVFVQSLNWAKDPQSWIGVIAVVTMVGFCAGVFDPTFPAPSEQSIQVTRIYTTHPGA